MGKDAEQVEQDDKEEERVKWWQSWTTPDSSVKLSEDADHWETRFLALVGQTTALRSVRWSDMPTYCPRFVWFSQGRLWSGR